MNGRLLVITGKGSVSGMAYQQILPAGTELIGEFRILAHLGSGGFANTYHALEKSLGREVAIKEYFPSDLAVRADNLRVEAKTPSDEKHFKWALHRFIREAQILAKFRHLSIVRVHRVFEENDTAYIVMEYVTGSNMEAWLHALGRSLTQAECDRLLPPLLDALEVVHSAGILHRDVKPANIYIRTEDSSPVLLDFGSARHAAADQAGTTAAIVSKGYSPQEAYTTDNKQQGPWTDIYGLAATTYRALSGQAPPESTSRMLEDNYASSKTLPATQSGYRSEFLDAIDAALKVMPRGRPQSVNDWRKQLFSTLPPTTIVGDQAQLLATTKIWQPISDDFSDHSSNASTAKGNSKKSGLSSSHAAMFSAGLVLLLISGAALFFGHGPAPYSDDQGIQSEPKHTTVEPETRGLGHNVTDESNADAMFDHAWKLQTGQGIAIDVAEANRWYRKAADKGQANAMYRLAINLEKGIGLAKDVAQANRWYRRAADMGHANAMYYLALNLRNGTGITKNLTEANRWYRKAATEGVANAMYNLAQNLRSGTGITKDVAQANRWYRRAADKGHPNAMYNLAVAYESGFGVTKDPREAARFMVAALKKDNPYAVKEMTTNSDAWSKEFRRELQRLMHDAGVYDGAIDGSFGRGTRQAIDVLAKQ